MNTTENNKLIAEFMQLEENNSSEYLWHKIHIHNKNDLYYHSDWNWLMEVIIKCRENQFFGSQSFITVIDKRLLQLDLLATYANVVEFIKMYNLKNK